MLKLFMKDSKITEETALEAVKTLIKWIGDDPNREGLLETPSRYLKSLKEYYSGYQENPADFLQKTFGETSGYSEMIVLNSISVQSHCEHHLAPILGKAHIGYIPHERVVGISKLARIVEVYSKRLQIQERLTAEIAKSIDEILKPKGVGVIIEAKHFCISMRGVKDQFPTMRTSLMLGCFKDNIQIQDQFLNSIRQN